jgi:hypothetical protein
LPFPIKPKKKKKASKLHSTGPKAKKNKKKIKKKSPYPIKPRKSFFEPPRLWSHRQSAIASSFSASASSFSKFSKPLIFVIYFQSYGEEVKKITDNVTYGLRGKLNWKCELKSKEEVKRMVGFYF